MPGGAVAGGIGGEITGDVSQPGTILADGLHALDIGFDESGFPLLSITFGPTTASTPNIQVFVGTEEGSPLLPTITGTPILHPSSDHPQGLAAYVDMYSFTIDFSDLIAGLVLPFPDLHFVAAGQEEMPVPPESTDPVYIPVTMFGFDNYANPGDAITESPSPLVTDVHLQEGSASVSGGHFLLDTGAQLTVISTQLATALGFDLSNPETSITVQGVAGTVDVPGFTLDALTLQRSDGGWLEFTNVPVYVLDVDPSLDGLLGMNLFNTATSLLYDPYRAAGPVFGATFSKNPNRGGEDVDGETLNLLRSISPVLAGALAGHSLPSFNLPDGSISGRVFHDLNGNGQRDNNEPGLAGRTVFLDKNNNGRLDPGEPRTVTDSSGNYRFTGLQPSTYRVREVIISGWQLSAPVGGTYTVQLASHQQVAARDFGNYQPGSLSGLVFEDRNRNGRRDPGERVLAGWKVFLDANNNGRLDPGEKSLTTGSDGRYRFTGLKPDTYRVREVLPTGWRSSAPVGGAYTVQLRSGQNPDNLLFGNYRSGSGLRQDGPRFRALQDEDLIRWLAWLENRPTDDWFGGSAKPRLPRQLLDS